jgi:hypothetical protein
MQEHMAFGITTDSWQSVSAIATAIAAAASLISTIVVAIVAKFTFEYMKSTRELVSAAKLQTEASIRQADASLKTLELMNRERLATDSYQHAVFTYTNDQLCAEINRYIAIISLSAKPWRLGDCYLIPDDWPICREYVSKHCPDKLIEMQKIEDALIRFATVIQGYIKAPDSQWLSTKVRRDETVIKLLALQKQLQIFSNLMPEKQEI